MLRNNLLHEMPRQQVFWEARRSRLRWPAHCKASCSQPAAGAEVPKNRTLAGKRMASSPQAKAALCGPRSSVRVVVQIISRIRSGEQPEFIMCWNNCFRLPICHGAEFATSPYGAHRASHPPGPKAVHTRMRRRNANHKSRGQHYTANHESHASTNPKSEEAERPDPR
jgi:hypothetical protein